MIILQEIIKCSNLMDDLNKVLINCLGTPQHQIVLKMWQSERERLLDLINEYNKQFE